MSFNIGDKVVIVNKKLLIFLKNFYIWIEWDALNRAKERGQKYFYIIAINGDKLWCSPDMCSPDMDMMSYSYYEFKEKDLVKYKSILEDEI